MFLLNIDKSCHTKWELPMVLQGNLPGLELSLHRFLQSSYDVKLPYSRNKAKYTRHYLSIFSVHSAASSATIRYEGVWHEIKLLS